ncbi:MAG: hypothetical protein ACTSPB_07135 [Candidatus Thorarchaeota archaeon]
MEQLTCEICGITAKNPGALASHRYYAHGKGRAHRELSDGYRELADEVRTLIGKLNSLESRDSGSELRCPECGGQLVLVSDGPGLFKFKCIDCWSK